MRVQRPVLSDRERQILELAAHGHIDTSIANELGISEATISTYWGRIRVKLGPHSRTELVAMVLRQEAEDTLAALKRENEELSNRLRIDTGEYNHHSNFYKDLLDVAADGMLIVDSTAHIEHLNDSAAELFGYENHELVGKHISVLVPERYRLIHSAHHAKYVSAPEKKIMGIHLSTPALHKSGREFAIVASLSGLKYENDSNALCIVRPVRLT